MSRTDYDVTYSRAAVARLLLQAAELYQQVHSAPSRGYTEPALCPHDRPYYDYLQPKRSCKVCALVTAETHAALVNRRQNLSDTERERVLDELVDLDIAMARMTEGTRRAVARFIDEGPEWITRDDVSFRVGQVSAVTAVWCAMNAHDDSCRYCRGKYATANSRREANAREGERVHAGRAPRGDAPGVPAERDRLRRPGLLGAC